MMSNETVTDLIVSNRDQRGPKKAKELGLYAFSLEEDLVPWHCEE
jgi:hypothetical protein